MKGQLASAFAELVKQVYCAAPHSVVSPAQLKRVVGKWAPHFSGYNQQDCQEFLRFLLDGIGEDLNRARTWPDDAPKKKGGGPSGAEEVELSAEFWLHHVSLCFDPFLDISLPIPKKAEVTERSKRTGSGGVPGTGRCTLDECLQVRARPPAAAGLVVNPR